MHTIWAVSDGQKIKQGVSKVLTTDTVFGAKVIRETLVKEGFRAGTNAFSTEIDYRYIPIDSRLGYFQENPNWDGKRRTPQEVEALLLRV